MESLAGKVWLLNDDGMTAAWSFVFWYFFFMLLMHSGSLVGYHMALWRSLGCIGRWLCVALRVFACLCVDTSSTFPNDTIIDYKIDKST